jgi:hypothetical protein
MSPASTRQPDATRWRVPLARGRIGGANSEHAFGGPARARNEVSTRGRNSPQLNGGIKISRERLEYGLVCGGTEDCERGASGLGAHAGPLCPKPALGIIRPSARIVGPFWLSQSRCLGSIDRVRAPLGPSGSLASGCPIWLSQNHPLTLAQIDLGDASRQLDCSIWLWVWAVGLGLDQPDGGARSLMG